ncbi:hypothetical protein [Dendrosporobacter sp. 1207_IL3150]|uniref:hypothetical protein n=1 Tax=Dendrosporobacter sp. 1207_IL3150 TaxID=3084054 RepID=UPI002FD8C039
MKLRTVLLTITAIFLCILISPLKTEAAVTAAPINHIMANFISEEAGFYSADEIFPMFEIPHENTIFAFDTLDQFVFQPGEYELKWQIVFQGQVIDGAGPVKVTANQTGYVFTQLFQWRTDAIKSEGLYDIRILSNNQTIANYRFPVFDTRHN